MKRIVALWGSKRWRTTIIYIIIGAVALIAAFLVGVADNLPGLALVYVAVTAFMLALVHTWRSVKRFLDPPRGVAAGLPARRGTAQSVLCPGRVGF